MRIVKTILFSVVFLFLLSGCQFTRLKARLTCGESLIGLPAAGSNECGVAVKGWRSDTANTVEVIFPEAIQENGHGRLPSGILIQPGNVTASPDEMKNMLQAGNEYLFEESYYVPEGTPRGTYSVAIIVNQKSGDSIRLKLDIEVPEIYP